MIATASLIIPYPKSTECKIGYFYGFSNEIAATVSVAHSTLLIISVSFSVKESKKIESNNYRTNERQINPKIVPTIPKKLIRPRF